MRYDCKYETNTAFTQVIERDLHGDMGNANKVKTTE